jgi:hypothetical protein
LEYRNSDFRAPVMCPAICDHGLRGQLAQVHDLRLELDVLKVRMQTPNDDQDARRKDLGWSGQRRGRHAPFATELELRLGMDMAEIAGREEEFARVLAADVASAAGGTAEHVSVVAMHAGSIVARVGLEDGLCGKRKRMREVVSDLVQQAQDATSPLRQGKVTRNLTELVVVRPPASWRGGTWREEREVAQRLGAVEIDVEQIETSMAVALAACRAHAASMRMLASEFNNVLPPRPFDSDPDPDPDHEPDRARPNSP